MNFVTDALLTGIDSAGGHYLPGYDVYLGYVDRTTGGHTATYATAQAAAAANHGRALSITTDANWVADIFDTEAGAEALATNVPWQRKKTTPRPIHYVGVSVVNTLVALLGAAGFARANFRIFSAHYTPARGAHLCGPDTCGPTTGVRYACDATQWAETVGGPDTYDVDVFTSMFFGTIDPPEVTVEYVIVEYKNELWSVFATAGIAKKCHISPTQVTALLALGAKRETIAPWNDATLLAALPVAPGS